MPICKEVIISELAGRGSGKGPESTFRRVTQVYEKDGSLIAEFDPLSTLTFEQVQAFAEYYRALPNPKKVWEELEEWQSRHLK